MRLLRRCVTAGWVDFTPGERPVVLLTEAGRAVMKAERPVRLLLPSDAVSPAPRERIARPGARAAGRRGRGLGAGRRRRLFEALRAPPAGARARARACRPTSSPATARCASWRVLAPRTRSELLAVHGIGAAKADRYGDGLLQVVARQRSAP